VEDHEQHADQRHAVLEHGDEPGGDELVDLSDVVDDGGNELARLRLLEEALRQRLQVRIQPLTHVVHEPLPQKRDEHGVEVAHHTGCAAMPTRAAKISGRFTAGRRSAG
jgi:hypothetical protein